VDSTDWWDLLFILFFVKKSFLFAGFHPAGGYPSFSVHFSHAREKEPKSALPPRPPSKGDATAPPVALTFW
jgi:hypothetical protein